MMLWEGLRERATGGGGKKGFAKRKTRLLEEGFMRDRKAAFFFSDTHLNRAGFNLSVHILFSFCFLSFNLQSTYNPNTKERKKRSPSHLTYYC